MKTQLDSEQIAWRREQMSEKEKPVTLEDVLEENHKLMEENMSMKTRIRQLEELLEKGSKALNRKQADIEVLIKTIRNLAGQ